MPTTWNLRNVLKERGINRASEISRLIGDRTGYQLSTQAVCDLLNTEPKMIRLETIQAFCDAFYFRLSDVLDVFRSAAEKRRSRLLLLHHTPLTAASNRYALMKTWTRMMMVILTLAYHQEVLLIQVLTRLREAVPKR